MRWGDDEKSRKRWGEDEKSNELKHRGDRRYSLIFFNNEGRCKNNINIDLFF